MSGPLPAERGPVVVDTGIFGAELTRKGVTLAERYRRHIEDRPVFVSFVTVAELRYGARWQEWGDVQMRRLAAHIGRARVVWPDDDLVDVHADLRVLCRGKGHGLADKVHEADRWVAATAVWLRIPLVTNDSIFKGVDGLDVLTELDWETD